MKWKENLNFVQSVQHYFKNIKFIFPKLNHLCNTQIIVYYIDLIVSNKVYE
jgi:hypothetical protein